MYQSDYDMELQKRMEEFIRNKGIKHPGVQQRGPPPPSPPYHAASPQPRSGQNRDSSYLRTQSKSSGLGYDSGSKQPSRVSPEPRENGASKRRHILEGAKKESFDSDSSNGKEKQAITFPEYKNYQDQVSQLMEAQMKLEVQLLKLKQEREALKDRGAQHEDSVMKENAVLQRGVKTQVQLTFDNLTRLQEFLASCKIIPDQSSRRDDEKSLVSESRRSNHRSRSRDESVEKEKKKRKKKHRTRSSSDEESDRSVERKKKKKRKKEKRRNRDSSRSDESDVERLSKRNLSSSDDEKKKKKKRKKKKSEDSDSPSDSEQKAKETKSALPPPQQSSLDQLMDKTSDKDMMEILSKMSAAYTNVKNENKNLLETVEKLQAENAVLRDLLSKVERKLQKSKDDQSERSNPKENISKSHHFDEKENLKYPKDLEKRKGAPEEVPANKYRFESEENVSRAKESRHVRKFSEADDFIEESGNKYSKKNEKVDNEQSWRAEERSRDKYQSKPAQDENNTYSYFKESWREKEEEETRYFESDKKCAMDRESELRARLLEKRKNQEATMIRREESPPKPKKDIYEEYDRTFGNKEGQARDNGRDQPRANSRRRQEERDRSDDRNDYRYNREREQKEKDFNRDDYQHEKERKKDSRYESDEDYDRKERRRQRSVSRNDDYDRGDDRRDAYRDSSKSRDRKYQDEQQKSKSKHSRRSRSRSSERYYEEKTSKKSESYEEKKLKKPSRAIEEKNDRICLEDWTPKQTQLSQDPTMVSLKKKLQQKEEEEEREMKRRAEEEEERNRQLSNIKLPSVEDIPPPPPPPEQPPRNPVAIQWGQTAKSRITPDKTIVSKKLTAFVGKMPGRGFKKMTPEREWAKPKDSPPAVPAALAAPVELPPRPPSPTPPPLPVVSAPPASSLNLQQILEAAQAHIKNRNKQAVAPEPPPSFGEIEIPLPPLPAAQDKDPEALLDTRPPKVKTPESEPEKSEMNLMLEKHKHVDEVPAMTGYGMYSQQQQQVGYNIPLPMEQYPPPPQQQSWIPGYHDSDFSGRRTGNSEEIPFLSKESDGDASELAMLGIDPDDLAGFGN